MTSSSASVSIPAFINRARNADTGSETRWVSTSSEVR